MGLLEQYAQVVGEDVIDQLRQLVTHLQGMKVVHVNSTKEGGGVAEILHRIIPLKQELGIDAHWEVISGTDEFFKCTKLMHNALQGDRIEISDDLLQKIRAAALTIHNGQIVIHLNADKPQSVDIEVTSRERVPL